MLINCCITHDLTDKLLDRNNRFLWSAGDTNRLSKSIQLGHFRKGKAPLSPRRKIDPLEEERSRQKRVTARFIAVGRDLLAKGQILVTWGAIQSPGHPAGAR